MKKVSFFLILFSALLPSCSRAENNFIHQGFALTNIELDSTLSAMPVEIAEAVKSDRKDFLDKLLPLISVYDDFLLLVDRDHPLSENSIPDDLVDLDSYNIKVNKKGMKLREPALKAFINMLGDAVKANHNIMVSSAYRSYEYQSKIYNYYISVYGQEETDKFSASPGTSQHQLGTAMDFGSISDEYALTNEGRWVLENSGKYGFSLSFPEGYEDLTGYNYEPWHYRYITPEGCIMQKKYFNDIQQYMLEYLHDNISFIREKQITDN